MGVDIRGSEFGPFGDCNNSALLSLMEISGGTPVLQGRIEAERITTWWDMTVVLRHIDVNNDVIVHRASSLGRITMIVRGGFRTKHQSEADCVADSV